MSDRLTARPPDRLLTTIALLAAAVTDTNAQIPTNVAPLAWWNDATDVTVGLWARSNPTSLGRFTIMLSRGFGGFQAATIEESVDFRLEVEDPYALTSRGLSGAVAGWAMDGTVGARLKLSKPGGSEGSTTETGVRFLWVATRETGYLDPNAWENAGSGEVGLFHNREWTGENQQIVLRLDGRGGAVYRRRAPGESGGEYAARAFARTTGEVSFRRRSSFLVFGARAFLGGVFAADPPPQQRAIPVHGADPYQTLGNPWFRTEGAPLRGGEAFYHAPGNGNLRGYRPSLAGRWVTSLNLELEADVFRNETGPLPRASVVAFWDGAIVDTLAVRSFEGRAYRVIADAGAGLRVWLSFASLQFPLRVEFPVYLSEPVLAYDRERSGDPLEFRWLVSVQPTF